ncbi:hypothetical protein Bcep1808_0921 [Burkholderia vietnamiensis G4]|uniref:Uncharacterized protein n=1 Tax=Burkholderia vietnamiensis (strain G4 / LMG 22486) TaxID=269482 RepID=A4JCC9_BURVG|nr:hypothetical protein Bcep1808_0921 [Burkholderia vietnamiensis G4]
MEIFSVNEKVCFGKQRLQYNEITSFHYPCSAQTSIADVSIIGLFARWRWQCRDGATSVRTADDCNRMLRRRNARIIGALRPRDHSFAILNTVLRHALLYRSHGASYTTKRIGD